MTEHKPIKKQQRYHDTDIEQVANILTHGLPIGPSLYAVWLLVQSSESHDELFVSLLYGMSIPFLFCVSSAHHIAMLCCKTTCRSIRSCLYLSDRATIFLFIAASYTPWYQLKIGGALGLHMTWVTWVVACLGVYFEFRFCDEYPCFEILFYVTLGVGPAPVTVIVSHNLYGADLLLCGGAAYISGLFFFHATGIIPFAHAIWHCHTTLGVLLHYIAVYKYLIGSHTPKISAVNEFCY